MTSTALKALTATTGNRKDTWNTPIDFVGDVLKFFGTVDLDPCCNDVNNPNVPALNYFTEETNGLAHDWYGKVFMNHPYSDSKTWVPYAALQYELGNTEEMVLLIKLDNLHIFKLFSEATISILASGFFSFIPWMIGRVKIISPMRSLRSIQIFIYFTYNLTFFLKN